jgi:IS5 family transposase
MAQRTRKTRPPEPKARYRVANWGAYDRALVARGAITLWIDEAALAGWRASGGKGWLYGDAAILCALSLRAVFGLALRQTEGFLADLTRLLGLELPVPDHTTLSRRAATLIVPALARRSGGPLHLAIDATGLKVHGEGEWKVRVHGPDKRRVWRKLHLAVDTRTGALVAHALTASEAPDGGELEGLLAAVDAPIATVCADKAYDSFDCHAAILAKDARPVIPPRKGAAIRPPARRPDAPPPAAPRGPASPRSAATPGRPRAATTDAPAPRPRCTATKPRSVRASAPAPSTASWPRPPSPSAASTASPPSACPKASGSDSASRGKRAIQPQPLPCNNAPQSC